MLRDSNNNSKQHNYIVDFPFILYTVVEIIRNNIYECDIDLFSHFHEKIERGKLTTQTHNTCFRYEFL